MTTANLIRYLKFTALKILIFSAFIPNAYSQITIYLDDETGLSVVEDGGQLLFKSRYAFWGAYWKWAPLPVNFEILSDTQYRSSGFNKALNFKLNSEHSRIQRQNDIKFELVANSTMTDIVGGGIAFKLDKTVLKNSKAEPDFLPNNTG